MCNLVSARDPQISEYVVKRRAHSLPFKLKVVGQALRPGAVMAAVARKHGIRGTLVHNWVRAVKLAFPNS
jgi:transposase